MYLTTLVGVLLVPIGLAAALVARFLARAGGCRPAPVARSAALAADAPPPLSPAGPPAPENAPPS
jgi:hypothetical protein